MGRQEFKDGPFSEDTRRAGPSVPGITSQFSTSSQLLNTENAPDTAYLIAFN